METRGFPLFGVSLAGSRSTAGFAHPAGFGGAKQCFAKPRLRPGGRVTSLRRQRSNQERRPRFAGPLIKLCLIKGLPCAARIGRPAQNSPAARAQTAAPEGPARCCAARRLRRGFSESPRVAGRAWVIDAKAETPVDSLITKGVPVKAQCWVKAPSEPLSSGATGGEVRRSCLSGRSPRVLRRPPVVSSARQSAAKQTTGSAGSPFLPTSLATQRSRAPAGAKAGFREALLRAAEAGRVCKPGRGTRPGQRNIK